MHIHLISIMYHASVLIFVVETCDGAFVRVVSIPKFASTGTAVIVDLDTLETHPISFGMYSSTD